MTPQSPKTWSIDWLVDCNGTNLVGLVILTFYRQKLSESEKRGKKISENSSNHRESLPYTEWILYREIAQKEKQVLCLIFFIC